MDIEIIKLKALQIIVESADREALLQNMAKMLKEEVYHYDWVGFYILNDEGDELYLGPYAGASTDHTRIPIGKGVCGQVAQSKKEMVVQDVTAIDNYLSCSINVQSEIVFPIIKNGEFVAELDIDSHSPAPFTDDDNRLLGFICDQLSVFF